VRAAQALVELGPGTGETTRALLSGMQKHARILGIEIVPQFVEILREIPDLRLDVVLGTALEIDEVLKRHQFPTPDVIVSGIPFSTMTRSDGRALVNTIHALLAPGGTFVAYQLRDRILELAAGCFGPPQQAFVLWNLPPLRILQWRKANTVPVGEARERCTFNAMS
jgi:phospholipid N-methyltransferase